MLDEFKAVSFCFWCYLKRWWREVSPGFPCITPRGSGASPQSFHEQVGAFGVREMFADD